MMLPNCCAARSSVDRLVETGQLPIVHGASESDTTGSGARRCRSELKRVRRKTEMGWRDVYKVHPAADVFPMLPEDELRKLGEDIKVNGLAEPIVLWSSRDRSEVFLIDGRNRLAAMELVGMGIQAGAEPWSVSNPAYPGGLEPIHLIGIDP